MGITVFTPAPLPPNDAIRSEAARQSGLLAKVNDPALLTITQDARKDLNARWCGIVLMVTEIQHVIASSNGLIGLFRRSMTFSSYVIYDPDEIFVMLDATTDERFAGNPYVDDGLVCFYAGAAVFDAAGYAVGALCVSDSTPRQSFSSQEAAIVASYADKVSATLR